jgi:uncharacterized protein (TIGR00730 family)
MNDKHQTISEEQYRFLKIIEDEYIHAFTVLNSMPPLALTVYGGAKLKEEDKTYKDTVKIAHELSNKGWGMVSGGGPGAMKAALVGGKMGETATTAFKIDLSREATDKVADNEYLFTTFSPRKHALRQSDAYLVVPGGWGTFDELFELITLQKVDKITVKPIILYDKKFWSGLIDWIKGEVLDRGLILNKEFDSIYIMDTPAEVITFLTQ